jgi:imidazolonepropionase-like amidohydrolase
LHNELELLVQAGLTPLEALQTATRNAAQYLGREYDLGTIEPGKLADLVLLDANPLADIRNARKIHAVLINGKLLQSEDLQKLLREVEASCRKENESAHPPGANSKYP